MARATERVGATSCREIDPDTGKPCGARVYVKLSDSGALTSTCPECEASKHYRIRTDAHRKLCREIGLKVGTDGKPVRPTDQPDPAADDQQPKPAAAGFSLGGLR